MRGASDIERGRAALSSGDWKEARARFEGALLDRETGDAHEGLGTALWWLCAPRESVRHRERAFVLFRQAGAHARACMVAVDLAITYLVNLGNEPAARGWVARGESLDEQVPGGTPATGWLRLVRGYVEPDRVRSRELLEAALQHARVAYDVDLELVALADLGLSYVAEGELDHGMAMLDEAMAATMGGERRRFETVAYNCCSMLTACHLCGDVERARQWCRVAEEFMESVSCPFLFARCRVHYGSLLYAKGQWARAERELEAAARMAEDVGPGPREEALARLAELRIRQGRLEEAEALLDGCDQVGHARLAAAALHLARGEASTAAALLRHDHANEDESERARVLALLVEADVARGAVESAALTAAALEDLAACDKGEATAAASAYATACVLLAGGDVDAAAGALARAVEGFAKAELPYEESTARLDYARLLHDAQPPIAIAETKNALRGFERMGATAKAGEAAALLRSLGATVRVRAADASAVLSPREHEVLGLVRLGLSNREVADRLFISRKTAAHHVSAILAKLGLRNRVELAAHVMSATVPVERR